MTETSTSLHTICRLLLRELRVERNVQQAQISQALGKASTSAWSKVETGDTPLTLEHILTACATFQIWPSDFFQTAQNYMALLTQNGWFVAMFGSALPSEQDKLGILANEYYDKLGSKAVTSMWRAFPVLQTPWPYAGNCAPLDVFRWALDPLWRGQASLHQIAAPSF